MKQVTQLPGWSELAGYFEDTMNAIAVKAFKTFESFNSLVRLIFLKSTSFKKHGAIIIAKFNF